MGDTLYSGKRFRVPDIIYESTWQCLTIEVDTSPTAQRLLLAIEQLKAEHGLANQIRVDKDPELVLSIFAAWCEEHDVKQVYIQKGKPQQNRFAERFYGSFR